MRRSIELEIGLHRRDAELWTADLRCSRPDEDSDIATTARLTVDRPGLEQEFADDERYGQLLSEGLFGDLAARDVFKEALATADSQSVPLQLRLLIGPSAVELHGLHWEKLLDPDGHRIATSDRIHFSRFLSSADWRPARVKPRSQLTAAVLIANPRDLDTIQPPDGAELRPLDPEAELSRARSSLNTIRLIEMASEGTATVHRLLSAVENECDIVYIACHGYLAGGETQLVLEDDAGNHHRLAAGQLLRHLQDMRKLPKLVVLASCQTAGLGDDAFSDDAGVLAALGPRLAQAGVPAVVAMQGNVSMVTMATFMPTLFSALYRCGRIDEAVAEARRAVRDRPDWWAPTLFMRLKSGRIWYKPGFADEKIPRARAIIRDIKKGKCTPILGPGLTDALLGPRQDLAARWAKNFNFPMAPSTHEDLTQVAQYLAITEDKRFPGDSLIDEIRSVLIDRYGDRLPEDLSRRAGLDGQDEDQASLEELTAAIAQYLRDKEEYEPHEVLAALPFPVYVSVNPDNLLDGALVEANRPPAVAYYPWTNAKWPESVFDKEPGYVPKSERPLIFRLFGHLGDAESLVLTEDDYCDFLAKYQSNKSAVPALVRRSLVDSSLLFLGFRLEGWDFRVLFSILRSHGGWGRSGRYAHVAVQIDPEDSGLADPERARTYLESYFGDSDISIYWGSVESFAEELARAWKSQ